jgi:hypothetical protein
MPLTERRNAMKRTTRKNTVLPSNLDESSDSEMVESDIEEESKEDPYIEKNFGDDESKEKLKQMRKTIVYVFIRGHSSLPYKGPYNYKGNDFDTYFHEYEIPDDMNLVKITGSANGAKYCGSINYPVRKKIITNIIKNNSNVNNPKEVAVRISQRLTEKETGEDKLTKNVVSENKTILNKVIFPFDTEEIAGRKQQGETDYTPLEILFLDDNNNKISSDIYPDIKVTKRSEINNIPGRNSKLPFKISDIIHFLYDYFKLKNVVLIDFTCSSFWEEPNKTVVNKDELTLYLNENNLHGGIKKRKNKTKRRKNKKNKRKSKKI